MIRDEDLSDLEAALPNLTGDELKVALAILEADRQERLIRDMPQTILDAITAVSNAIQLILGADPAPIEPHPAEVYTIINETGGVLPYDEWRDRRTGALMTDREKADLGPIARWDAQGRHDVNPYSDEVISLLPSALRERIRQARATGSWTAPIRRRMLEDLDGE